MKAHSPQLQRCLGVLGVPVFAGKAKPQARFNTDTGANRSAPAFQASHIYREITPTIRRRLVDDSRDLYDRAPFYRGIIERLVTYVIGSGIWPYSATGDAGFDADADAAFSDFAEHCEIRGGTSWPMLQEQLYRAELVSGDGGTVLFEDDFKRPKVIAIDGVDIGSRLKTQSADYFDGVWVGKYGEPIAYDIRFADPLNSERFERVERKNFIHQFDPERIGQVRGIPLLAAAFPTARDIHDIFALYKQTVKNAASITDIIKTSSGELDPEDALRTGGTSLDGSDEEGNAEYYRRIFGSEAKIIKREDEWSSYKSDAPKDQFVDFMNWLGELLILAARIPPSVVMQMKVGGADTRRDIAVAARVFEKTQARIARQLLRIRNYVIQYVIGGPRMPVNWKDAVIWQMPKSPTVDSGREAAQDREDVRSGLMSRQEYHGRYGTDYRRHSEQILIEAEDIVDKARELASRKSIPFEMAMALLGYSQNSPQIAQPVPTQQQVQTQ